MVQPAQVQVIRQICCMLWWLPRQLVMGSARVAHPSACWVFGVSICMLHAM